MKTCTICGAQFEPYGRQKICMSDPCRSEQKRRKNAKYRAEHPGSNAECARKWEASNPDRARTIKYAATARYWQRRRNALAALIAIRALCVEQQ